MEKLMEQMDKLKKFVEVNELKVHDGHRNYPLTVICGYSQYLGLNEAHTKEYVRSLDNGPHSNKTLREFERLWEYCDNNNYKGYWSTEAASKSWRLP